MNGPIGASRSKLTQGILALVVVLIGSFAWILSENPSGFPTGDSKENNEFSPSTETEAEHDAHEAVLPSDFLVEPDIDVPSSELGRSHISELFEVRGRVTSLPDTLWPAGVLVILDPHAQPGNADALSLSVTETSPLFHFRELPPGKYELRLQAMGFRASPQEVYLKAGQTRGLWNLPLLPDNKISGLVLNVEGKRVNGLSVSAIPFTEDPTIPLRAITTQTNEMGEFSLEGLRPGDWRVFPGTSRNALDEGKVVSLLPHMHEAWVDLSVPIFGSAVIQLIHVDSTEPLPKLKITALRDARKDQKGHAASTTSDRHGKAHFAHLPPGEYTFTAFGAKFRRTIRRATIAKAITKEVEIPMRAYPR